MRLIIAGCEYSGATTLAKGICQWAQSVMGGPFTFHDHWKIPEIACYPQGGRQAALTEQDKNCLLYTSDAADE